LLSISNFLPSMFLLSCFYMWILVCVYTCANFPPFFCFAGTGETVPAEWVRMDGVCFFSLPFPSLPFPSFGPIPLFSALFLLFSLSSSAPFSFVSFPPSSYLRFPPRSVVTSFF
jgi:hypothetical protein